MGWHVGVALPASFYGYGSPFRFADFHCPSETTFRPVAMPPDGTPPGIAGKAESEKNSDAAGDVNGGRDEAVFPVVEFPVHAYNIASFREAVKSVLVGF